VPSRSSIARSSGPSLAGEQLGHAERRRIERDLHDSTQQRLVSLRIHLTARLSQRLALRASAFVEFATGLALLAVPTVVFDVLIGSESDSGTALVARILGGAPVSASGPWRADRRARTLTIDVHAS
jgi:hypothetical protein